MKQHFALLAQRDLQKTFFSSHISYDFDWILSCLKIWNCIRLLMLLQESISSRMLCIRYLHR